jgi:uncharacterized protein
MKTAVLKKNGVTLIETVELAVDLKSRLIGLLGRSSLGKQRAIYLSPCSSIHTFFMRFPIDLIFLDRDIDGAQRAMLVTSIVRGVKPWRIVFGGGRAWSVIEMESGWFPVDALKVGDKVSLSENV